MQEGFQIFQPQSSSASTFEATASLSSSDDGLTVELRPRGYLRSFVYTHQIAGHDCWSFISDGLAALGQKEIVITVCREQNAPRPESPLKSFELLYSLVQTGKVVDHFDIITFYNFQFLGRNDITSLLYTKPIPLENLPSKALPEKYLQATPLTKPEEDVALRYGALRFLSHLGYSVKYFPYPPWIDPNRRTVISPNNLSESLLNNCAHIKVGGVQAVKVGDNVHVYMSSKAAQVLTQSLAQWDLKSALVLHCELLELADSCLLWKNGQSTPMAIGSNLKRTNLCFLGFCPLPDTEFILSMCEDGYFLVLSHSDLEKLRDSIATRRPMALLTRTGDSFHLNMKQDMYHDHAKDRVYVVACTDS